MTEPAEILSARVRGGSERYGSQEIEIEFRYDGKEARLRIPVAAIRSDPDSEMEAFAGEIRKVAESLLGAAAMPLALPGIQSASTAGRIASAVPRISALTCGRCLGFGHVGGTLAARETCPECHGTGQGVQFVPDDD